MVCEHCGGAIVALTDDWQRCSCCGRDPACPARPPTDEELRGLRYNGGRQVRNPEVVARNDEIIALFESGVTAKSLAGRFGLSTTRIQGIVKYSQ